MLLLRTIVFVALLAALVFVGLQNNTPVALDLFAWQATDVPLYLALFGAALFGLILGLLFAGIREIQWRMAMTRQKRESADAQRELQDLRVAPLDGPADPGADEPGR